MLFQLSPLPWLLNIHPVIPFEREASDILCEVRIKSETLLWWTQKKETTKRNSRCGWWCMLHFKRSLKILWMWRFNSSSPLFVSIVTSAYLFFPFLCEKPKGKACKNIASGNIFCFWLLSRSALLKCFVVKSGDNKNMKHKRYCILGTEKLLCDLLQITF